MPANNKIITLDNLTEYDTKIKEYILTSALQELTEDTNVWELSQGIYKAAPGIKLYYNTNSGYITVGTYGDLLSVAAGKNGSVPFYLMGRSVQENETINTIVVGVAQNNLYGVCDVYDMAEMRSVVHIYNNQTIYGKKTFSTLPESTVVPTTNNQLVNKKYVDDTVSNMGDVNQYFITGNSSSNPFIFKGKKKGVYHFIDKKPGDNIYYKFDTSDSNTSDPLVPLEINILKDINGTEANGTPLGYYTKAGMSFRPFSSVYCVEIKRGTSSSTGLSTGIPSNGSIQYVTVEHQQTISSEKTFSTLPKSTVVPTNDAHLVNKKYVDDSLLSNAVYLGKVTDYNSQEKALNFDNLKEGVYSIIFDGSIFYGKLTNSQGVVTTKAVTFSGMDYRLTPIIYLVVPADIIPEETQANSTIATLQYLRFGTSYVSGESDYDLVNQKFMVRLDSFNSLSIAESKGSREYVSATSAQTISGKKTFNTLPESSVVPTTNNQLVNKKYVDDNIPSIEACTDSDIDGLFTSGGEE